MTAPEKSLASLEDVDALLEAPANQKLVTSLLLEASDLILAEMPVPVPDPVPGWLRRMCARVVYRAVNQLAEANVPIGMESVGQTAGPFSQNFKFSTGANDGGVWLTSSERRRLRRFGSGAFSYRMW